MERNIRKPLVIHPYLFAIIPVVFLYAHNIDRTSLTSALFPLIVLLCATIIFTQLLRFILRDIIKSGLIVSFILFIFFSHGHLHALLLDWLSKNFIYRVSWDKTNLFSKIDIMLHLSLFMIWFMLSRRLINIILKKKADFFLATKFLNTFSICMISFSVINIGLDSYKKNIYQKTNIEQRQSSSVVSLEKKPDIYYIILDGYGREDVLRDLYNFDNSDFLNYLANKGFYVASKSCSNYAWTFLSLPSSLNFEYINYLINDVSIESNDLRIPFEMTKNNQVAQFLKGKGYLFVHFKSTCGATLSNRYADMEIGYDGFFRDDFLRILVQTTALKFLTPMITEDLADCHLYAFKMLESVPQIKYPTFTFVHLLLPHNPFIFDSNGNVKHHVTLLDQFQTDMLEKKDYIEQLTFVNKKMKVVIDTILKKSITPPIIILQSDHGPQVFGLSNDTFIKARMAILNAYYLPHGNYLLYDSITPVNTFRVVFNYYFGEKFPLLDDKSYVSTFERPYSFKVVSCSDEFEHK